MERKGVCNDEDQENSSKENSGKENGGFRDGRAYGRGFLLTGMGPWTWASPGGRPGCGKHPGGGKPGGSVPGVHC